MQIKSTMQKVCVTTVTIATEERRSHGIVSMKSSMPVLLNYHTRWIMLKLLYQQIQQEKKT